MNIRLIPSNFDKNFFNQKAPHPLQSWEWGRAREKMGIEVLRMGEFENENLKNVYQITFHKIPYTNYKIGYLPRSNCPSQKVLEFLYDYGKKNKIIFIKIEPHITKSKLQITNYKLPITLSSHPLFPEWTIMLDLTKSENEILKNMHPKTRYNLRLAQKKGIYVKEMTNKEGFEIFAELYFATCKRQKYFGHNYNYHQTVFKELKNKIAYILVAFYQNTPLSAYEIFIFNDILYYPYGGSSDQYKNLMSNNLLMWEAVKFGQKMGCKTFDMWGSLPADYDKNNKWAGFTRFKEGYGGKFIELIGSYDLVINKNLYNLYNVLYKIRNAVLPLSR